jgi:hypothetical protein
MPRPKSAGLVQRFLSTHSAVHNTFNLQRHRMSRRTLRLLRADASQHCQKATAEAGDYLLRILFGSMQVPVTVLFGSPVDD